MDKPVFLVFLGFLALGGQSASAVDLSWAPQLRLGMRSADNVRWSSNDKEAALGFDSGGGLALKAQSDIWNSSVNPSFNFRRFAIGEDLDADEYGVKTQHQYKLTERLQASLQADYVRDSTLSSELTDAGRQNDVANRDAVTLQPGISYLLDDVTSVNAGYLFTDVSFDASADAGLVNYKYQQWNMGGTHYSSNRLQVFVNGFISDFDVQDIGGETWTYGGMVGLNYGWSDTLSTSGSIGYQTSSIDFLVQQFVLNPAPPPVIVVVVDQATTSISGPIANFGIKKTFDRAKAEFSYARRVSPTIRGAQTQEDDMVLTSEYEIDNYWRVGFRGTYNMRNVQAEETGRSSGDLNRDQLAVGATLSYKATREISVRTDYRFTRNSFAESRGSVYVNALFLSLVYSGQSQTFPGL